MFMSIRDNICLITIKKEPIQALFLLAMDVSRKKESIHLKMRIIINYT